MAADRVQPPWYFSLFAPLVFLILRLTVSWRWRTVFLVALVVGVVADFVLEVSSRAVRNTPGSLRVLREIRRYACRE